MTSILALTVIVLAGLYLVGLGLATFLTPSRAARFLLAFAGSASVHYFELLVRLAVGVAFLAYAPRMFLSAAFVVFGWVLLITTAALLAVPWRWHHRFAQRAVPQAVRHLRLVGLAAFLLGAFIVVAAITGAA